MKRSRLSTLLLSLIAFAFGMSAPARGTEPRADDLRFFETNVRPLLASQCFNCHGAKKQSGGLRLDSLATIIEGGDSGAAIVPGKPAESLLVEAIKYESFEMPPSGKMSPDEIEILAHWVTIGAPWPANDATAIPLASNGGITDEDRQFWSFQPVRDVMPPTYENDSWSRNDIDRFVLRRLHQDGLSPAEPADRLALIRRAYFDLIGLPPTPEEVDAFLADQSSQAYEATVDRLLESQHYGERWARHWLDLVRYAESDGYKQDAYRPHAWRYRDYVIRSLNADKPYDQFVREQIAGDEIAPEDPDALIATGYLRHWIYEYNQRDVRTQWDNILNDVTDVTGDVFLGMGMGCARCHDHKFDPILQKDYFRLRSFFAALVPCDDLPAGTTEQRSQYHSQQKRWLAATHEIREQIDAIEQPIYDRAAQPAINKFPPDIRPMMRKPAAERDPLEQQLAGLAYLQVDEEHAKLDMAAKLKGEQKSRWEELQKQLAEFEHLKPEPLPPIMTVAEVGSLAPPTIISGDRNETDVAPGFLSVLDPTDAKISRPDDGATTGRRTALAGWLTDPNNPLATRVIVNRVWQYHFGRGLVATSSDFGQLGERPTHPELLDWLTRRFVNEGWSLKKLHRLIMNSATYRQSALREAPSAALLKDPDNRLLWRMNVRRLDAEQIRDAMLATTGELNTRAGGPSVDGSSTRRTIYTKVIRNDRDPLLAAFDAPDGFDSTSERNVTTTPTQSLLMINGQWPLTRAEKMAERLTRMQPVDDEQFVRDAYRLAFGHAPNSEQIAAAVAFLHGQSQPSVSAARVDFCHVLLNSNKFIYVD